MLILVFAYTRVNPRDSCLNYHVLLFI